MKRLLAFIFLVQVACVLSAEQIKSEKVSKDAAWVMHLDLDLMRTVPDGLCGWLNEQSYQPEAARRLAANSRWLGIDIRSALKNVTAYGLTSDESQAVALFEGAFDKQQILARLNNVEGYKMSVNDNEEIHSWYKNKNPEELQYASFHSTNVVAFASDEDTLKHALAILRKSESGADGSSLLNSVEQDSLLYVAFQVDEPLPWPKAGMLRNANAGALNLKETDGNVTISLMLNAFDQTQADNLFNVAQGLKAMA